jgi:hypothetical protein
MNKCLAPYDHLCNNIPRFATVKTPNRNSFIWGAGGMPLFFRWCLAAALVSLMPIGAALAQDVISTPPQAPVLPPAVKEQQNNNPMQVFAPPEAAPASPFQWGHLTAHPHVDYQVSYGNGIQSAPGQQQNTVVQQVSPGVLFNLGDHWILDYTPTLVFYSSSSFQNTVNQSVQLGWGTVYGDWFFNGSQSYVSTSNPDVATAAQTDQETYSTAFDAVYQFNDKMSLNVGLNQIFNYVGYVGNVATTTNGLSNSKMWSTMDWLNYQFWPRFSAGLGLGGGYTIQDNSPDSVNEQYQAQVNWRATDKISYQLSGGLQCQQYLTGGASDLVTPIFSATIQYQPFEQTKLSVTASRTVMPASFQNQTTENTGIMGGFNQRLLGRLTLDLSGGYTKIEYLASASGLSTSRNDDVYTFNARLSCPFLKRGTVAVFYSYSQNSSSQSGFSTGSGFGYTSTQVGLEIGFRY